MGLGVVFGVDEAGRRVTVGGEFARDRLQILFELAPVPLSGKVTSDLLVYTYTAEDELSWWRVEK
jgi:hypothetical protein